MLLRRHLNPSFHTISRAARPHLGSRHGRAPEHSRTEQARSPGHPHAGGVTSPNRGGRPWPMLSLGQAQKDDETCPRSPEAPSILRTKPQNVSLHPTAVVVSAPPPPVVTEQPRQTACEQQIFVAHSGGGGAGRPRARASGVAFWGGACLLATSGARGLSCRQSASHRASRRPRLPVPSRFGVRMSTCELGGPSQVSIFQP